MTLEIVTVIFSARCIFPVFFLLSSLLLFLATAHCHARTMPVLRKPKPRATQERYHQERVCLLFTVKWAAEERSGG